MKRNEENILSILKQDGKRIARDQSLFKVYRMIALM
jgi:hypothetical protein